MLSYLSLGSNLDNPVAQIKSAIIAIDKFTKTRIIKRSGLYKSKAWGIQEQPDFINAVVAIETSLTPTDLLDQCQKLEAKHGRVRKQKWAQRTLDLDILLYENKFINTEHLVIPHPFMLERAFVLAPLFEIAPDLKLPHSKDSLGELIKKIDVGDVELVDGVGWVL